MNHLSAAVVIPTYKRGAYLLDTLEDLDHSTIPFTTVVVVDQSPEIWMGALLERRSHIERSFRWPLQWVDVSVPNLPHARNVGLSIVDAHVVIYCDDDVRVAPEYAAAHLAAYTTADTLGVAGRVSLEAGGDGSHSAANDPVGRVSMNGAFTANFNSTVAQEVHFGQGCNMSFRTDVLRIVGGFDERYVGSFYREEGDVFARLRRDVGGRIWFEPRAHCLHRQSPEGGCRAEAVEVRTLDSFRNEALYFLNCSRLRALPSFLYRIGRATYGLSRAQGRSPTFALRVCGSLVKGICSFLCLSPAHVSRRLNTGA